MVHSLAKWYSVNITGATSNTALRNIVSTQKTSQSSSLTAAAVKDKADLNTTSSKDPVYRGRIGSNKSNR